MGWNESACALMPRSASRICCAADSPAPWSACWICTAREKTGSQTGAASAGSGLPGDLGEVWPSCWGPKLALSGSCSSHASPCRAAARKPGSRARGGGGAVGTAEVAFLRPWPASLPRLSHQLAARVAAQHAQVPRKSAQAQGGQASARRASPGGSGSGLVLTGPGPRRGRRSTLPCSRLGSLACHSRSARRATMSWSQLLA
mmetsp:Transcript_96435/g.251365  ORF Transcript_96435/g.251365 Transcript_96435/m.251365 type:complete len:202 (-) Transcript_96435:1453-2058(-)